MNHPTPMYYDNRTIDNAISSTGNTIQNRDIINDPYNNNNDINCDNTKSVELNIQSDSEEKKKDTKYPILFKQKIIS